MDSVWLSIEVLVGMFILRHYYLGISGRTALTSTILLNGTSKIPVRTSAKSQKAGAVAYSVLDHEAVPYCEPFSTVGIICTYADLYVEYLRP